MKDRWYKKGLVLGIIVILIGMSITISTGKISGAIFRTDIYDGTLLGYVNDTSGNPIEGALVRVCFHETYEEDYSDSTGYYHVTNIPTCKCLKNATCSKESYKTEWVLLGIAENTIHDFILTAYNHPPNKPTISGPSSGPPGKLLVFTFNAMDPDGDDVRFLIDWGDSTSDTTSFVHSGYDKAASHMWDIRGTFIITAIAEDAFGNIGLSSTGQITIPRDKPFNFNFNLLERLLNYILQISKPILIIGVFFI